jgi:hypothetical protein
MFTVVLALAGSLLVLAPPATASGSYTVTATPSATSLDVGQTFQVKGHVSPRATGKYAVVQMVVAGHWVKVARARIGRWGNYRATVAVTQAGDNRYRVLKRRWHNTLRGFSPVFTITGWRWRAVTELPHLADTNNTMLSSGTFMGTVYQPYLRQGNAAGDPADLEVTLGQQCDRLDGHVSGDATSATPSTSDTTILGSLPATPTTFGQAIASNRVSRDADPVHIVRGADSIAALQALEVSSTMAAGNYVGWGALRVHCKS